MMRLRKLIEDEKDKLRNLRNKKGEADRLRRQQLKDEEARYDRERRVIEEKYKAMLQKMADDEAERQRKLGRDLTLHAESEKRRMQQEAAIAEAKVRISKLHDLKGHEEENIRYDREELIQEHIEWRNNLERLDAEKDKDDLAEIEVNEQNRQRKMNQINVKARTERLEELRREKARSLKQVEDDQVYLKRQKEIEALQLQLEKKYGEQKRLRTTEEESRRKELLRAQDLDDTPTAERAKQKIQEENVQAERLRLLRHQSEASGAQYDDERLKVLFRLEDEERERMKLKRFAEGEQEFLIRRLAMLEGTYMTQRDFVTNAPYDSYDDDYNQINESLLLQQEREALNIPEDEVDRQVEKLFATPPIVFQPRKGFEVDNHVKNCINDYNITFPIVHIQEKLYLVGTKRVNIYMRDGQVLCRIGGKYQNLKEYVKEHSQFFKRTLVVSMIKSGEDLHWVVDQLKLGLKHVGAGLRDNHSTRYSVAGRDLSPLGRSSRYRMRSGNRPGRATSPYGGAHSYSYGRTGRQDGMMTPDYSRKGGPGRVKTNF